MNLKQSGHFLLPSALGAHGFDRKPAPVGQGSRATTPCQPNTIEDRHVAKNAANLRSDRWVNSPGIKGPASPGANGPR